MKTGMYSRNSSPQVHKKGAIDGKVATGQDLGLDKACNQDQPVLR